jgi:hypothetical protein
MPAATGVAAGSCRWGQAATCSGSSCHRQLMAGLLLLRVSDVHFYDTGCMVVHSSHATSRAA